MKLLVGPAGTPPSPVALSAFQITTVTAANVGVSYVRPPTGTVVFQYRPTGATSWVNADTGGGTLFGASAGTYTGLAAGMPYELSALATNNGGSVRSAVLSVTTQSNYVPPPATSNANRYDVLLSSPIVGAGGTANGTLVPNGNWSGGAITLTPTGLAAVVVTLPSSGNAAVAFQITTQAAGELSLVPTNNAGLYNPYPAPLTVWVTGASDTVGTFTAALTRLDKAVYQRDTATGNTGFKAQDNSTYGKGWGEVWVQVGALASAANYLYAKLYDAGSSGATTAVGSGTLLTGPTRVHGAWSGPGTLRLLLPASPKMYYLELATDLAFTQPVRVAQRFAVGVVTAVCTRSYETGITNPYADSGTVFPFIGANCSSCFSGDPRYGLGSDAGGNNAWRWDGVDAQWKVNGDFQPGSSGAQEWGRLVASQLGVFAGITGMAAIGYGLDNQIAHDGTFNSGFKDTVNNIVGGKFRYLYVAQSDWDGTDIYGNPSVPAAISIAECRTRYLNGIDWIARTYPACAVQGWAVGNTGWEQNNGSAMVGPPDAGAGRTRVQMIIMQEIEPANGMVISKDNVLWNEFRYNHSTMASRLDYVRPSFRQLMAAEVAVMGGLQTQERGPVLAQTGVLNASARTLTLGFTIAAGANLVAVGATYTDPTVAYNTASPAEIASTFSVYLVGQYAGNGKAVAISGVTVDNSAKVVVIALAGTSGITYSDGSTDVMPTGFSVNYAADYGVSNATLGPGGPGRGAMLADDTSNNLATANGIPYGKHLRPALNRVVN